MGNYIPQRDSLFNNWLSNFSTLITASPATYGLVAGDATAIATVTTAWTAAYAAAINPATRTPVTVGAKDTAKINALATARPYSQQIALNAGVSSANKLALGLNPRTNTPTPIPTPTTSPVLTIPTLTPTGHVLRYRDEMASPTVKAKPAGATALELHGVVVATGSPTTPVETWPLLNISTKTPLQQNYDSSDKGKVAWYVARWLTRTGLVGPWSPQVSQVIPG